MVATKFTLTHSNQVKRFKQRCTAKRFDSRGLILAEMFGPTLFLHLTSPGGCHHCTEEFYQRLYPSQVWQYFSAHTWEAFVNSELMSSRIYFPSAKQVAVEVWIKSKVQRTRFTLVFTLEGRFIAHSAGRTTVVET